MRTLEAKPEMNFKQAHNYGILYKTFVNKNFIKKYAEEKNHRATTATG